MSQATFQIPEYLKNRLRTCELAASAAQAAFDEAINCATAGALHGSGVQVLSSPRINLLNWTIEVDVPDEPAKT